MRTPRPELTPDQRARMRAAIHAELVELREQALASGVDPATFAAVVEQRKRALT